MTQAPQPDTGLPLVLRSPLFAGAPVLHGFAARTGGVSRPPFDSMNFSPADGDPPANVDRNASLLLEHIGAPGRPVVVLEQVHGDSVLEVDGEQRPGVHAAGKHDALVTIRKDVALGIKTADCAPVLLYDAATGAMAAVHAGWKGTAIGIAARTVEAMSRLYGSRPGDIAAVIGPCIRPCCYPVGDDVADAFEKAFGKDGHLIGGDRRADMQAANRTWLERAGVLPGKIGVISLCTSCHPDLFFSHRRDNGVTGRHLNFITGA